MPIAEESVEIKTGVMWLQEGVINEPAAELAVENGLRVIMNRCILKEHMRLIG
jgi:predicted CoA-binding protein